MAATLVQDMIPLNGEFAEDKEMRNVEKRRAYEAERKKRVFDHKFRIIGQDIEAIHLQQQDNARRRDDERQRELDIENDILAADRRLLELERQNQEERKEALRELLGFQALNQTKDKTREWDLNDPKSKQKDLPARVGDDDPRLSASGAQILEGEDLGYADRIRRQREQQKEWADKQRLEKLTRKQYEDAMKRLEELRQAEITRQVGEQEAATEADKKNNLKDLQDENKKLAKEKRDREQKEQHDEMMRAFAQIENQLNSAQLMEDTTQARSALGPNRVRADHYKGMTPAERQAIFDDQKRQADALRAKREEDLKNKHNDDLRAAAMNRALISQDRSAARDRSAAQRQLLEDRKKQAAEDKERRDALDALYTNAVDPEWYDWWNRTTR